MYTYKTEWTDAQRFLGKALHKAVQAEDVAKVSELIKNPELDVSYIWEPLPYELKGKSDEEVRYFSAGAPVIFKTKNIDIFRELLKHPNAFKYSDSNGNLIFYTDENGDTIFHAQILRPAESGVEQFRELLNAYPDAYKVENNMGIPLYQKVISNDRADLLDELLKHDMSKVMGNQVLWAIVAFAPHDPDELQSSIKMLDLLEEHHWDLNAKDSRDGSPLHWAARLGNEAMINVLLSRGVDGGKKDSHGHTYLEELNSPDSMNSGYTFPS